MRGWLCFGYLSSVGPADFDIDLNRMGHDCVVCARLRVPWHQAYSFAQTAQLSTYTVETHTQ